MRRIIFCVVSLLSLSFHSQAQEARPNTLTREEIAQGLLLLFDGESTFGWEIHGEARVDQGVLVLGGEKETTAHPTTTLPLHKLDYDGKWTGKEAPKWGSSSPASSALSPLQPRYHEDELKKVKKDFDQVHGGADHRGAAQKRSPFFVVPAGSKLYLRNMKLKPLGLEAIFNGKDLSGWKEHPGKKSKVVVTAKGDLNIKDGPGDLQTEGKWADFVLQLECISHGTHLNSGVFFRCRPGEYQQGYEAQIRNEFKTEPQEYTIEEYDPATNKLLGKKKIKSTAFDYGTGAIYRRMPARKAMAKDNEWFTLTVVAHGRHLATWVNGIQVVAWTDNRPLSDNARNGCRLDAGPISLQGHDPTTNLSFRNFRIAELPTTKK